MEDIIIKEELQEEVTTEINFTYTEEQVEEFYNTGNQKFNNLLLFLGFISIILITLGIKAGMLVTLLGAICCVITIIMSVFLLIVFKNNKSVYQKLIGGQVAITLEEDRLIINEKYEEVKAETIVLFSNILSLEETDHLLIVTTKSSKVFLLVKDQISCYEELKNEILKNVQIYNGIKVTESARLAGEYDYHLESEDIIRKGQAKQKVFFSVLLSNCLIILIAAIIYVLDLNGVWFGTYLPISIFELILINKINKKLPKKERLTGEKIVIMALMILTLLIAIFSLLALLEI